MKRSAIYCAAVLLLCACSKTVKVNFDPSVSDYSPIVEQILRDNPRKGLRIVFSKGVFPFYPEQASLRYLAVSNNDNGCKRIAFLLEGREDVSIEGHGSEFLLHGAMMPFAILDCRKVSISGLSISYDHPFVFEAEVLDRNEQERSFCIKPDGRNPWRVEGNMFYFSGYDWEIPLGEHIYFDAVSGSPLRNVENYQGWYNENVRISDLGGGLVKVSNFNSRTMPPVGSIYVDKGQYMQNRLYPGFALQGSKDIYLKDINIHDSGAMSLIAENCHNIVLERFNTCVKPGSGKMIASSADATHFVGCTGKLELRNCLFESMLDDATNIHGAYMTVESLGTASACSGCGDGGDCCSCDGNADCGTCGEAACVGCGGAAGCGAGRLVLRAGFGHFQQQGFDFASEGDSIVLVDRKSLRAVGKARLLSVVKEHENSYLLELETDAHGLEGRELALENLSRTRADVLISGCTVRKNRARSLLISTRGKVLIENNYFASMMAGIRICGDANFWFESGPTDDITIRNNTFYNLANGGWEPQSVLQIDPVIPAGHRSCGQYYHRKISFLDNTVYSAEDQLIYALSTEQLEICGNRFVRLPDLNCRYPGLGIFDLQYCSSVSIGRNEFIDWPDDAFISRHQCLSVESDSPFPEKDQPNPFFYEN